MRHAAAAALLIAAALPTFAACTSGNPQVELSQAGSGTEPGSSPTVTVTVVDPNGPPVTATATVTVTATPTVTVTMPAYATPTTTAAFTQAVALVNYQNLVSDISLLDGMTLTGSPAALQLDVLAQHFAALESTGAPPGLDPPTYFGRLASLRLFANAASQEAAAGSPQAAARYVVIRRETGVLLGLVNGALHTSLALPPPRTTSTTP